MDCILPGSSVHGILQARVLEWVAIAFSMLPFYKTRPFYGRKYKKKKKMSLMGMKVLSHFFVVQLVTWSETIYDGMPYGE